MLFWSLDHASLILGWQGGTSYICPVSPLGPLQHNPAAHHNLSPLLTATMASLMTTPCKQQTLVRNVICEADHHCDPPTRLHPVNDSGKQYSQIQDEVLPFDHTLCFPLVTISLAGNPNGRSGSRCVCSDRWKITGNIAGNPVLGRVNCSQGSTESLFDWSLTQDHTRPYQRAKGPWEQRLWDPWDTQTPPPPFSVR